MSEKIKIVGLTGGIATGKSTCVKALSNMAPEIVIFDADACVMNLYKEKRVLLRLSEYFGGAVMMDDGTADKKYIMSRVFSCESDKLFLEHLFHPLVREECLALLDDAATKGVSPLFIADIPLLFESKFDFGQSLNLLVATSEQTQFERLIQRNNWDIEMAHSVLSSQMPIQIKHSIADVVFWNEGGLALLSDQCHRFLQSLSIQF